MGLFWRYVGLRLDVAVETVFVFVCALLYLAVFGLICALSTLFSRVCPACEPVCRPASEMVRGQTPIWDWIGFRTDSFLIGPDIRQEYPLNLSILISGGKETNKDSPSNGE